MNIFEVTRTLSPLRAEFVKNLRFSWFLVRVLAITSVGWAISMALLFKLYDASETVRATVAFIIS